MNPNPYRDPPYLYPYPNFGPNSLQKRVNLVPNMLGMDYLERHSAATAAQQASLQANSNIDSLLHVHRRKLQRRAANRKSAQLSRARKKVWYLWQSLSILIWNWQDTFLYSSTYAGAFRRTEGRKFASSTTCGRTRFTTGTCFLRHYARKHHIYIRANGQLPQCHQHWLGERRRPNAYYTNSFARVRGQRAEDDRRNRENLTSSKRISRVKYDFLIQGMIA